MRLRRWSGRGFSSDSACQGDAPDKSPLSEAQLSADLIQLNPGLLAVLAPGAGDEDDDDVAEVIPALATEDRQREREGEPPPPPAADRTISAALDSGDDYGAGRARCANRVEPQPTVSVTFEGVAQGGDRNPGLTTNVLMNVADHAAVLESSDLSLIRSLPGSLPAGVQYFIFNNPTDPNLADPLADRFSLTGNWKSTSVPTPQLGVLQGPLVVDQQLPEQGVVADFEEEIASTDEQLSLSVKELLAENERIESGNTRAGSYSAIGPVDGRVFQQGFVRATDGTYRRDADNFLIISLQPRTVTEKERRANRSDLSRRTTKATQFLSRMIQMFL